MALSTGISPRELMALDGEMFDALVRAQEEHWPMAHELAASLLEVAHLHLLAFLRVNSKKGARLPEPITWPRPGQDKDKPAADPGDRISLTELASLPGLTAELREAP
jgi:hypothetical protein